MIGASVRGAANLDMALRDLEPRIRRNLLRRAVRRAANVVRDAAKQMAPRESGLLRKDIRTVLRRERGEDVRASVGVMPRRGSILRGRKREEAYYALWVERGHRIVPRRGRIARSITLRRREARRTHGRVPPYPFLMPALEAKQGEVLQAVTDELRRGLLQEIANGNRL